MECNYEENDYFDEKENNENKVDSFSQIQRDLYFVLIKIKIHQKRIKQIDEHVHCNNVIDNTISERYEDFNYQEELIDKMNKLIELLDLKFPNKSKSIDVINYVDTLKSNDAIFEKI